ncbi:MAG TPA: branched-chain amino acid ABC transporter substrate-binding protein [Mycobacterium sp.]|nr:branched-chain amino acid ABC transporter substrate-binding protein [Mycobacterium sp.]
MATRARLSNWRRLLRIVGVIACLVLIALAGDLLVRLRSIEYTLAVQAQITPDGRTVSASDTLPADPAGNGKAVCPPLSIAIAGGLTGPDSEIATNVQDGVQLAVDRHNAANAGCQVQIKQFDTGGDPQRASDFAPQIVGDAYTVGLIGPALSGVAQATGALFDANGLPSVTASASSMPLSGQGWTTFFRAVASDDAQGRAIASFLRDSLQYKRLCVVGDNGAYATAMSHAAAVTLGKLVLPGCSSVNEIKADAPDVVVRVGSKADSAPFVRQVRSAGITTPVVLAQGIADERFVTQLGRLANGLLLACPCEPDPDWFSRAYRNRFGKAPGAYSAEGYDLATIMLRGVDAGRLVRRQMLDWMRHYDGQGIARRYQWTAAGELTDPTIWIYRVQ